MTLPRPLRRGIVHLAVIGLVAATAAQGISNARTALPAPGAGPHRAATALTFDLVAPARAAGDETVDPRVATFELVPNPSGGAPTLARAASRFVRPSLPSSPAPLPTPVAPPPAEDVPATGIGTTTQAAPAAPTVIGTGVLVWPVAGGEISQYYHSGHLALDVAASYGSTVVAADAGVVTWAGWRNNGGGYVVEIDHGNGMQTVYNHLSSIWVSAGQAVGAGQGIAGVGCTGICTGPHVHFEVIVGGYIVNPLRYL